MESFDSAMYVLSDSEFSNLLIQNFKEESEMVKPSNEKKEIKVPTFSDSTTIISKSNMKIGKNPNNDNKKLKHLSQIDLNTIFEENPSLYSLKNGRESKSHIEGHNSNHINSLNERLNCYFNNAIQGLKADFLSSLQSFINDDKYIIDECNKFLNSMKQDLSHEINIVYRQNSVDVDVDSMLSQLRMEIQRCYSIQHNSSTKERYPWMNSEIAKMQSFSQLFRAETQKFLDKLVPLINDLDDERRRLLNLEKDSNIKRRNYFQNIIKLEMQKNELDYIFTLLEKKKSRLLGEETDESDIGNYISSKRRNQEKRVWNELRNLNKAVEKGSVIIKDTLSSAKTNIQEEVEKIFVDIDSTIPATSLFTDLLCRLWLEGINRYMYSNNDDHYEQHMEITGHSSVLEEVRASQLIRELDLKNANEFMRDRLKAEIKQIRSKITQN